MNLLDLFNPDDINSNNPVIPAQPGGMPTKAAAEALGFDPNAESPVEAPAESPVEAPAESGNVLTKIVKSFGGPEVSQPGFGDIYNSFKTGGAKSGLSKVVDYLNSPEGIQLVGGLVSHDKPYAGLSMVNNAQDQIKARQAYNMASKAPLSNSEKYKMAVEMSKNDAELKMNLQKMGLDWQKYTTESQHKAQEIANAAKDTAIKQQEANTGTQKATADVNNQQTERQQESQKTAESNRSWVSKIFGSHVKPMVAQNQQGHKIVSYDGGQTWQ